MLLLMTHAVSSMQCVNFLITRWRYVSSIYFQINNCDLYDAGQAQRPGHKVLFESEDGGSAG